VAAPPYLEAVFALTIGGTAAIITESVITIAEHLTWHLLRQTPSIPVLQYLLHAPGGGTTYILTPFTMMPTSRVDVFFIDFR